MDVRQRDPRRRRRAPLVAALSFFVLGTVFACSSSNQLVPFGSGVTEDGSAPSFIAPDSGDASVAPPPTSAIEAGLCVSTECPAPYASCATYAGSLPTYACDTNTSNDVDNCGSCGHKCPRGSDAYHFERACVEGTCQPFCQAGYADCNGSPDDGCESDPKTDTANCGICGNACPAGVACVEGKCGCPPGQTNCDGTCVDTKSDDFNCGACGTRCSDNQPDDAGTVPPHMFYGCKQGQCTELHCKQDSSNFWVDCNGSIQPDGCEVDLAKPDLDNCGACGNACTPGQQCFSTSDTGMDCQCKGTTTYCPPAPYNQNHAGCADLETDPTSCGSCGYVCPTVDNADITCSHGRCGYSCQPGRADCNGRQDDGCEVDLGKDPRNCGGCGTSCDIGAGQPCVGGQCATKDCDAGIVQ